MVTDEMVERAGHALERARHPQWTDEQFEVWWNRDPFFCEHRTSWGHFRGTGKEHVLWEARTVLEAAQSPEQHSAVSEAALMEYARTLAGMPSKYGHSDIGDVLVRYLEGKKTLTEALASFGGLEQNYKHLG